MREILIKREEEGQKKLEKVGDEGERKEEIKREMVG